MKVKFLPKDIDVDITPGQSVLNAAHDNDIHIQSVCKGIPSCAECRVRIVEGVNNILPPSPEELNLIGTAYFVDQRRLSCQMRCFGDVVVDLSEQEEKEAESTKRPQGKIKKEEGDSQARLGNMLEDQASIEIEYTEEEKKEAEALIAEKEARQAQQQRKKSTKKKKSKLSGQKQSGDKPTSKKKSRNRNRNRNRKKKKPEGS